MTVSTAWGQQPGRWPLPSAVSPYDKWHRAVALGGQGRYSAGVAELDALAQSRGLPAALHSLMASTRGSWLRQTGSHEAAAQFDGVAIAWVGMQDEIDGDSVDEAGRIDLEARCDALTGLAADRLGSGRLGAADALLMRCGLVLRGQGWVEQLWRQHLRLLWVRAELAMYSGDGQSAMRHALDARERATDIESLRHRAKTELIVAAAYSSVGDGARARASAHTALDMCVDHGLVPLQWAGAMLLNGLGEVTMAPRVVSECAETLRARGAVLVGA